MIRSLWNCIPVHPEVQQAEPQLGRVDLDYSEEDPADTHEDEYEKPPPEDEEYFVVDDVEWEDAESINLLDSSWWSVLVEGALIVI